MKWKTNKEGKSKLSIDTDRICDITGWAHEKAINEIRFADSIGIKRSVYFNVKGYEWTHHDLEGLAFEMHQKRTRAKVSVNDDIELIVNSIGCSNEEARANLERRKTYNIFRNVFVANECYKMDDDELKFFAINRDKRLKMIDEARSSDVLAKNSPEITELFSLALPARRRRIMDTISLFKGDIDKDQQLKLAEEMDYLNLKYNFFLKEFFLYGLENKSRSEIEAFIANANRKYYFRKLSTPRGFIICRNKALSYEHLSPLYKRELVAIDGSEDLQTAINFIKKHRDFVFKPVDSSFGKGIRHITIDETESPEKIAEDLLESVPFILEETIVANDSMKQLHPESINTIRVTTYMDDNGKVTVHLPFLKMGQGSNFVDNGGSGGIFALIDAETGIVISDGKDEANIIHKNHPDTGVSIKGFRIPNWDSLISFAEEAARMFPDVRYAGWDMALSKDKGWMIVEVNCRTQFYGQQMCDEIGKKYDFEDIIDWKHLEKKHDEFEEIWKAVDKY